MQYQCFFVETSFIFLFHSVKYIKFCSYILQKTQLQLNCEVEVRNHWVWSFQGMNVAFLCFYPFVVYVKIFNIYIYIFLHSVYNIKCLSYMQYMSCFRVHTLNITHNINDNFNALKRIYIFRLKSDIHNSQKLNRATVVGFKIRVFRLNVDVQSWYQYIHISVFICRLACSFYITQDIISLKSTEFRDIKIF